jgi:hypothetical protein
MPSAQVVAHELGVPPQWNPVSIWHVAEHPSPLTVLPSSQVSTLSRRPSPQTIGSKPPRKIRSLLARAGSELDPSINISTHIGPQLRLFMMFPIPMAHLSPEHSEYIAATHDPTRRKTSIFALEKPFF